MRKAACRFKTDNTRDEEADFRESGYSQTCRATLANAGESSPAGRSADNRKADSVLGIVEAQITQEQRTDSEVPWQDG